MRYTLYIQKDCSACIEALEYAHTFEGSCEIRDIAEHKAPVDSSYGILLPALFHNDHLVAYGPEDIRRVLKNVRTKKTSG